MRYEHLDEIDALIKAKLISARPHPTLPLFVYNYTAGAQGLPIKDWTPALCDCRGLILDAQGEVVGRPFKKFWNYEQVLDQIPSDLPFTVWEKLDGSLGIVCNYRGNLVVATRGSFESDQAKFATKWLAEQLPGWVPLEGLTYLAEIIYPENRIVVDYGDVHALKLLAVMDADGTESLATFYAEKWDKAQAYTAPKHIAELFNGVRDNAEGYVVRWDNGFRSKVKFEEYCRLHRLITQVSTRSIWELMRANKSTCELVDRVPEAFKSWVQSVTGDLQKGFDEIIHESLLDFAARNHGATRKEFAEVAKTRKYPKLLFALLDGRAYDDMIWKMVEPRWSTPFRKEIDG